MAAAYDDACPLCKKGTAGCPREPIACSRCALYSHVDCWANAKGCAACGCAESLDDRTVRREDGATKGRWLLLALTVAFVALTLTPFRSFGYVQVNDVLRVDVLRIAVFAAAVACVTRLVRG